jgi:hypothetical protein
VPLRDRVKGLKIGGLRASSWGFLGYGSGVCFPERHRVRGSYSRLTRLWNSPITVKVSREPKTNGHSGRVIMADNPT